MANTALLLSSFAVSNLRNLPHGAENFADLVEALGERADVSQFTAEQLALICDFADSQRQAGFHEGVTAGSRHTPADLAGGYESSTDTCTAPAPDDTTEQGDEDDEPNDTCRLHVIDAEGCEVETDRAVFAHVEDAKQAGIEKAKELLDCNNVSVKRISLNDNCVDAENPDFIDIELETEDSILAYRVAPDCD